MVNDSVDISIQHFSTFSVLVYRLRNPNNKIHSRFSFISLYLLGVPVGIRHAFQGKRIAENG